MQVSSHGHGVRSQILVEEPLQFGLQRGAAPRDSPAVAVLAVAEGRQAARRLRDAQGDNHGHGVVSIFSSFTFFAFLHQSGGFNLIGRWRRGAATAFCPDKSSSYSFAARTAREFLTIEKKLLHLYP